MTCPSYAQLFLLLSGSPADAPAPATELADARKHLDEGCPVCSRRMRLATLVLDALRLGELPQVPAAWRKRAEALAYQHETAASPQPAQSPQSLEPIGTRVRQYLARLVFDASALVEPALALRGEGPAERHLLYQAGPFEVDLALLESGALVGQVLAPDEESPSLEGCVCVLHGEGDQRETPLDANGDFHFAGVQPSSYDLVLEGPALRLLVPGIELGEENPDTSE